MPPNRHTDHGHTHGQEKMIIMDLYDVMQHHACVNSPMQPMPDVQRAIGSRPKRTLGTSGATGKEPNHCGA